MLLKQIGKLQSSQKARLLRTFLALFLIGVILIGSAVVYLEKDKGLGEDNWEGAKTVSEEIAMEAAKYNSNATDVIVGTYIENVKEVVLKNSNFRVVGLVWFKWQGDDDLDMVNNFRVYKGSINKKELVKDETIDDNIHYQLARIDVTINKDYFTKRYPLESHQFRIYIESNYTIDRVMFTNDSENSGLNSSLDVSGFELRRYATGTRIQKYEKNNGDPTIEGGVMTSEQVTEFELNRSNMGLYVRCFIALFGTMTWILIALYLNSHHDIDPLSLLPAVLVGTVTNIMVGANLLPEATDFGLLEIMNFWGILTLIVSTLIIIKVNSIRRQRQDDFASVYGRVMFYTILVLTIGANIMFPVAAYMF